jgi:hypothetical protein
LQQRILAFAREHPEMYRDEIAKHFQCVEHSVYLALRYTDAQRPERAPVTMTEDERARLVAANWERWEFASELAAHFAVHRKCPLNCVGRMSARLRTELGLAPWTPSVSVVRVKPTERVECPSPAPVVPAPVIPPPAPPVAPKKAGWRSLRHPADQCKNGCGKPGALYSDWCTGEFCSKACSRAFATKARRAEINARVSQTLKGRANQPQS